MRNFALILALLLATPAFAAPVITSAIAYDDSVVIGGTSFGTHPLIFTNGVGNSGWIEQNAYYTWVDSLTGAPGWQKAPSSGKARISPARYLSGTRSVNSTIDMAKNGNFATGFSWQYPDSSFTKLYASFWIYWQRHKYNTYPNPAPGSGIIGNNNTQWKLWRVNDAWSISDRTGDFYFAYRHFPTGDTDFFQYYLHATATASGLPCGGKPYDWAYQQPAVPSPVYARCCGRSLTQFTWLDKMGSVAWDQSLPKEGSWSRVQILVDRSDIDVRNGWSEYSVLHYGIGETFKDRITNLGHWTSDLDCRNIPGDWNYFHFQSLYDDTGANANTRPGGNYQEELMDLFYDDIYLQPHTIARVEVANARDYDEATVTNVLPIKSWSDTGIVVEKEFGVFSNTDSLFVFVIDDSGNRSAGSSFTGACNGPTLDLGSIIGDLGMMVENLVASKYYGASPDSLSKAVFKYEDTSNGNTYEMWISSTPGETPSFGEYSGIGPSSLVMVSEAARFFLPDPPAYCSEWIDETSDSYRFQYADYSRTNTYWEIAKRKVAEDRSGWSSGSWSRRVVVTADSSKVGSGTFTNLPVLIDLANAPSALWGSVANDGRDIRFTAFTDTTKLPYQLVSFDAEARTGQAWVLVPTFSKTANKLYIYFGNPNAASASTSDVWASYEGVYHYEDAPIQNNTPGLLDSSGKDNHGILARQLEGVDDWNANYHIAGKVGKAWQYAVGRTAYNRTLKTDADSWVISAWVYVTEQGSNYMFQGKEPWFWVAPTITSGGDAFYQNSNTTQVRTDAGAVAFNTWKHVAFVMDGATDDVRVYVDGALVNWSGSFPVPGDFTAHGIDCPRERCGLGSVMYPNRSSAGNDHMDGLVDELRVRNGTVTQGWLKTEFNNQNNPATFWTWATISSSPSQGSPVNKLNFQE